jgi:hypothetical protein
VIYPHHGIERNEQLIYKLTWMNIQRTILNEISHSQKLYNTSLHLYNIPEMTKLRKYRQFSVYQELKKGMGEKRKMGMTIKEQQEESLW